MAAPATGPAAEFSCPPTPCPGPGPLSWGDSRRAALLGAASVPRPRRRIHSPTLVSEAEAPPKPPPLTPAPCLQLQGQTEAGALWSLLSTGGVASPPRTTCVIYLRPWKPQGPLSSWLPVSRALEGHGRKVPVSSHVSGSESWIQGTVQLGSPHPEFFAAHPLYCLPIAFWEPASWLFLAPFPPSGVLGIRPPLYPD